MKLNIQLFADGSVIIEARLSTKKFDKDIDNIIGQIHVIADEERKIESKPVISDEETQRLNELIDKENELKRQLDEIIQEKQSALFIDYNSSKQLSKQNQQYFNGHLLVERTGEELEEVREKFEEIDEVQEKSNSNLSGIAKKVGRWGVALFGIRSIYGFISSTATKLAGENDEIAGKLEAIKGSLTNALAPVVEVIINLVYRLLTYLNVILKTFLGVDLFAKTSKSAKSTVGSAQKLRKIIAPFDEMNILNDNKSGGGGGSIGGTDIEPIDTSKMEETVTKYKKMWDDLLKINRTDMKEMLLEQDKTWGLFKLGWFDTIQGIAFIIQGIVDVVSGVFKIIKGIADGNTELIKEGVLQLITGIGEIIRGLIQTVIGTIEMIIGLVQGIGTTIGKFVKDKIIQPIIDKIDTIKTRIKDNFKEGFWKGIANTFIDIMNRAISKLNSKLSISISSKVASLLNGIGVKASAGKYQIVTIPSIPRLAKGGIINLPGRGVPIGGYQAIGGENRAEGVIPLTDSQQMALLGEAIGRYITINANITNTMNGRVISRELKKIENENSFASNN